MIEVPLVTSAAEVRRGIVPVAPIDRGIHDILSTVSKADLAKLRKDYSIPTTMTHRKPKAEEVPSRPRHGEIAIHIPAFINGLKVPMAPAIKRLL